MEAHEVIVLGQAADQFLGNEAVAAFFDQHEAFLKESWAECHKPAEREELWQKINSLRALKESLQTMSKMGTATMHEVTARQLDESTTGE